MRAAVLPSPWDTAPAAPSAPRQLVHDVRATRPSTTRILPSPS